MLLKRRYDVIARVVSLKVVLGMPSLWYAKDFMRTREA